MFFDDWAGIWRTVVVGALAYIGLVAFVRVAGKRTLSKMNAFDLIVTVALGSTLATILLSRDVALAEGLTAFALLIFLQFSITWLSVRTSFVPGLVKSEPSLLAYRGEIVRDTLRGERVSESEVFQAVRQAGFAGLEDTHAVVLETDGNFSVIGADSTSDSALGDVRGTHDTAGGGPGGR